MEAKDFIFVPILLFLLGLNYINGKGLDLLDLFGFLVVSFVIEIVIVKYILKPKEVEEE